MTKVQVKKLVIQGETSFSGSDDGEVGMMKGEELLQLKRLEFQEKEERKAQLRQNLEFTQLKMKELKLRSASVITLE